MANSAMTVGVAIAASQADQETGTSTTTVVTPGRQQFHPCASKFWVRYTSVTSTAISSSYNVTSLTDGGTGITTITIATDFSADTFTFVGNCCPTIGTTFWAPRGFNIGSIAAGAVEVRTGDGSGSSAADLPYVAVAGYGDQ